MTMKKIFEVGTFPLMFPIFLGLAILARLSKSQRKSWPRLVWGSTPIINNSYWSRAMREAGYSSETFTQGFYSRINGRADWDKLLEEKYPWSPGFLKPYLAFLESLFRYDIFFISFDGFFLKGTQLEYLQSQFLKLAGASVVVIPYGGDSYVYGHVRSQDLVAALQISYPEAAKSQRRIRKTVDYWTSRGDVVITGLMSADGFGRNDVMILSPLFLDLHLWEPTSRVQTSNGVDSPVTIVHSPNHKGFKGSEFICVAIDELREEGFRINYELLQGVQNSEIQSTLTTKADILVEQIVFGHGLNAIEGMAAGITTITNLENEDYIRPFRRWSYFQECPLVSASPETIKDVLRKLIQNPRLRSELGKAGRDYAEKYHGLDSAAYLFTKVIEKLAGRDIDLINLYHPLSGEHVMRRPKITVPKL